jgi:hypothetical protein
MYVMQCNVSVCSRRCVGMGAVVDEAAALQSNRTTRMAMQLFPHITN